MMVQEKLPFVSLAHISLMELLVVLYVELHYTRAKQQWYYLTDVISAR